MHTDCVGQHEPNLGNIMPRPLSSIKQELLSTTQADEGGGLACDAELGTPDASMSTSMSTSMPMSGVDSMRNVVKQTVPNPLAGPAR